MKKRWLLAVWLIAAMPAIGRDLVWQRLDSLAGGDRALAEATLFEMFGGDPAAWPDWIDPAALYVPTAQDRLLVVRRPVHAPCGQYKFAILGPVTPDGRRDLYGDFCAGDLSVIAASGHDWPDLMLREGRVPDDQGVWQRVDQRLRYHDGQWWRILSPEQGPTLPAETGRVGILGVTWP